MSRTKRNFNNLIKRLEKGAIDMVQVTRNGDICALLVRREGSYQPPRELFDDIGEDYALTDEDRAWLNMRPVGKEII